jgi:hypothetical protein
VADARGYAFQDHRGRLALRLLGQRRKRGGCVPIDGGWGLGSALQGASEECCDGKQTGQHNSHVRHSGGVGGFHFDTIPVGEVSLRSFKKWGVVKLQRWFRFNIREQLLNNVARTGNSSLQFPD